MRQRELSIAKITRPRITGVYERKRLFKLLDQGRDKPVVWISGPAGSGKTTLVGSYLDSRELPCLWYQVDEGDADIATFFYYMGIAARKARPRTRQPLPLLAPEYAFGIPTFTRRFFEALYSRLSPPFVLVFDNYHHIPESSPLHEIMQIGLSIIPEGITVVVISRSDPPTAFTGLRAGKQMEVVGWEELRLTLEESRGIMRRESANRLSPEKITHIHEKAGGWAAGLILMTKGSHIADEPHVSFDARRPEDIFNYFATELFDKADEEVRDFLLRTAVLPRVTPAIAGKLTNINHADRILSDLNRRNYFTAKRDDRGPTYQYHPLFREFLLTRAQAVFPASQQQELRTTAGRYLEQSGQIEDAAELYRTANDTEGLTRMIMQHAPLLIRQGRYRTLEHWIMSIPPDAHAVDPGLVYWLGVCTQPTNPSAARKYFEQAFISFTQSSDSTGELLAWAGIVETFLYEWNDFTPLDFWIQWFEKKPGRAPTFSSPDVEARAAMSMAAALMIRRPGHPRVRQWWERALSAARETVDSSFALQARSYAVNFYSWVGDMKRVEAVARDISVMAHAPQASPLAQLTRRWLDAAISIWVQMPADGGLDKVVAALEYAEETGVHVWDHMLYALGVYGALLIGDLDRAREFTQKLAPTLSPERRHGYCHYHYLIAWERLVAGDLESAKADAERALELAEETGFQFPLILCRLETAYILLLRGETASAAALSSQAYDAAVQCKSRIFQYAALLITAQVAFVRGKDVYGIRTLRQAFQLGKEHGYFNQFWWRHAPSLSALCSRAFEAGIEIDYARTLVLKHRLVPKDSATAGELWPWPLKIYTFGTFRVEQNGTPLSYSRKAPKRPLDLLRLLVALGENAREERIMEALWPDAEGDAAQKSLSVTLVRLRELLGVKEALQVNEGMISLDGRYVWTDVRAFESIIHDAETRGTGDSETRGTSEKTKGSSSPRHPVTPSSLISHLDKAISLYRGPLLEGEEQAWSIRPRERFRELYLRAVETLGAHWEKKREWRKAIEVYRKGIHIDDLVEKFHIGTMNCLLKLGSKAEALSVYRRLQKTLHAYGLEPSEQTASLYQKIISKR